MKLREPVPPVVPELVVRFAHYRSILVAKHGDMIQNVLQIPKYHLIALRIMNDCSSIDGLAPRELIKSVRSQAAELARLCNLSNLHRVRSAVIEMAYPINSLREKFVAHTGHPEERERIDVVRLIRLAVAQLQDFAKARNVSVKYVDSSAVRVEVVRRDVVRAIGNIVHNAIKYSWSREVGEPPFIRISVVEMVTKVNIEVENWGVAIPADEISTGSLLRFGFRGRRSGDRRRIGSGIGLADADRVAKAHNGAIRISSRSARAGTRDDDYSGPFLTTVMLELPIIDREVGHETEGALD